MVQPDRIYESKAPQGLDGVHSIYSTQLYTCIQELCPDVGPFLLINWLGKICNGWRNKRQQ